MTSHFYLPDTSDTEWAAKCFAEVVTAGDTILLQGPVGAGKTDFARRLIQTRQSEFGCVEEIPSPTFTLVQTYPVGDVEIWHADLYRLCDIDELYELGLESAFETAICLVEWPERLGPMAPPNAMCLRFEITENDARILHLDAQHPKWDSVAKMLAIKLTEIQDT